MPTSSSEHLELRRRKIEDVCHRFLDVVSASVGTYTRSEPIFHAWHVLGDIALDSVRQSRDAGSDECATILTLLTFLERDGQDVVDEVLMDARWQPFRDIDPKSKDLWAMKALARDATERTLQMASGEFAALMKARVDRATR